MDLEKIFEMTRTKIEKRPDTFTERFLETAGPAIGTAMVAVIVMGWLVFQALFWGGMVFILWALGRWIWSWA
jgi:hypothetical protein